MPLESETTILEHGAGLAVHLTDLLDEASEAGWELEAIRSVPAGLLVVHRRETPGEPFVLAWPYVT